MSISRLYGVDKTGAGHSFRAYFIVDPDQVIRMTMLILWKMMMLRKKIMLLMTVLMLEVDNLPAGGPGQGGERPYRDDMFWQVRNIHNLSSRGLPIYPTFLSKLLPLIFGLNLSS